MKKDEQTGGSQEKNKNQESTTLINKGEKIISNFDNDVDVGRSKLTSKKKKIFKMATGTRIISGLFSLVWSNTLI